MREVPILKQSFSPVIYFGFNTLFIYFGFNTLFNTAKISGVILLKLNTMKGTETAFRTTRTLVRVIASGISSPPGLVRHLGFGKQKMAVWETWFIERSSAKI